VINTINSRLKIGFPSNREAWNKAPAVFRKHDLKIGGHPVMEDWENGYMRMLAEIAASNGGTVLELGYGMGLSSAAIQSHDIGTHCVVECHPDVLAKAVQDLHDPIENNRAHILSGFWQDVTPLLRSDTFDGILFDTYPLKELEIHSNHFDFFEEAFRLLKPGGVLTYYSDEVDDYSSIHMDRLLQAGFQKEKIKSRICNVNPPEDCEYWQAKTILAPIVKK
jgi:guanidinoacetate N-methyltransferase